MKVIVNLKNGETKVYHTSYVECAENDVVCIFSCPCYYIENVERIEIIIDEKENDKQ